MADCGDLRRPAVLILPESQDLLVNGITACSRLPYLDALRNPCRLTHARLHNITKAKATAAAATELATSTARCESMM
jgi:hypothetical protein